MTSLGSCLLIPFYTEPHTQPCAADNDDWGILAPQRREEERRDRSQVIKCHGAKSPGSLEDRGITVHLGKEKG